MANVAATKNANRRFFMGFTSAIYWTAARRLLLYMSLSLGQSWASIRPTDSSRGVMFGKIFLVESSRLQHSHCECITHYQHGRGAGSWGKIERAGFLGHFDIQHHIAITCE